MKVYFLVFAIGIVFGVALVQIYDSFFGGASLSDEDVYYEIMEELDFFIRVSGLGNKTLVELPVHLSNHKPRIIMKISAVKSKICNGSSF